MKSLTIYSLIAFLLIGCSTVKKGISESPTAQYLRGETDREEYLNQLEAQNTADQIEMQRQFNSDETKAFNLKTKRFEYVPADYLGKAWNNDENRWEFWPERTDDVEITDDTEITDDEAGE